jgi:hypothetical protein
MRLVLPGVLCVLLAAPAVAEPNLPAGVTLPVLRSQVAAGGATTVALRDSHDPPHVIDGHTGDWTGTLPGFGGGLDYSHGELVYEDHIFDAYGADNGQDAQRLAVLDPLTAAVPEFYRLDPAYQYVPGEFGIPTGPLVTETHYGDLPHQDQADLSEVRLAAAPGGGLDLLARTTTMTAPDTALLVLLDTKPGSASHAIGMNSGLTTTRADVAVLLTQAGGRAVDLATGATTDLPAGSVAYDTSDYTNAIEARLPAGLLEGAGHSVGVAVAAGITGDATRLKSLGDSTDNPKAINVANVAFRTTEPARNWFDRQQALALYGASIDDFFATADLARMRAGASERYVPGPGYHDRIFTSTPAVSAEKGQDGLLQHYGVYLPSGYGAGRTSPTQYWLHFRGGDAHIAAAVAPGIFEDMGENYHSIVVTPDGRGTSGWYVGKSQADVLQVWADSHRMFRIDRNRTYIAGHSMGGWASYLLPVEHPDWFAAAFPASGPPTQGAWTGVDVPGCDAYTYAEYSPCFVQANGGRARDEWTTPLLDNLREVPYAIYQGVEDELVPVSGVLMQAKRLQDLGYRYRLYLFHGQEHYGPPVVDQWAQGAAYEHQFVRDPNPPQVTYVRSMPFEHAIEQVNADKGQSFSYPLDHAYWMSGLQPVDESKGSARFDGRSLAIPLVGHTTTPEADSVPKTDQASPYTMVGQAWKTDVGATPATSNGFTATLTGARAVTLSLRRMALSAHRELDGSVQSDAPLELTLRGVGNQVGVTVDGAPATVARHGRALTISVPAGRHAIVLSPA